MQRLNLHIDRGVLRYSDHHSPHSIESRPDLMADDLSLLFDLLECEVLNPRVAMTVDFEHVPKAHKMIENGGLQGAIVLRP